MNCTKAARGATRCFQFDLGTCAALFLKWRLARQIYVTLLYFTLLYMITASAVFKIYKPDVSLRLQSSCFEPREY